jgi:hypothetical protein
VPTIRLFEILRGSCVALAGSLLAFPGYADSQKISVKQDTRPSIAPDIREDESRLKVQRGDFVAVPIPISSPTFGTGLIAGAAYFYPQTEEQAKKQPASLTAVAGAYTDNDSRALAIVQQNYWNRNRWRFTGAIGAADLRLSLSTPETAEGTSRSSWRIDGDFFLARLSGQFRKGWYGGAVARVVDANQNIEPPVDVPDFVTLPSVRSVGLGLTAEYDTRDMPTNAATGRYLKAEALFNDESIGSNKTYQNYSAKFSSYHAMSEKLVLAWQLQGCHRGGRPPLWDACTIGLRGFSATEYLGRSSASGQVEARRKLSRRWGVVGFGGGGYSRGNFSGRDERTWIPSYGVGLRFTVLPSKRINMRLDYARSKDGSDAIHFLVGEAF